MSGPPPLTIALLCQEAAHFAHLESTHAEPSLYGVTDGKRIGTYLEHKFRTWLQPRYTFLPGNSASGIDFPGLPVDVKVTSLAQPQSSCPFTSARQKIYGLGYHLLVFVYDKADEPLGRTATLRITDAVFIDAAHTADFQLTRGLLQILATEGNLEDLEAFLHDRRLPVDDVGRRLLAEEVLRQSPEPGYLTISNALQWRLQYGHALRHAGAATGVLSLYRATPLSP